MGKLLTRALYLKGASVNLWCAIDLFIYLHFSDNADERAAVDRAWKLRPVIDALQRRFQMGYTSPATMAFDEAMLLSQSSFNRMRVFMKDKQHRWGTKVFMLCWSTTVYCIHFEVYCGKQEQPN